MTGDVKKILKPKNSGWKGIFNRTSKTEKMPSGGSAWLETKWNKAKTLSYRRLVWRKKDGKKRAVYVKRLGGQYKRKPPIAKVDRTKDAERATKGKAVSG